MKFNGLRTLSGWESREAMEAFRNSGHHLDAMKNTRKMGVVKSVAWEVESEPGWDEAKERLQSVQF